MIKTTTTRNRKTVEIDISHAELINILCPELKGVRAIITDAVIDGDGDGISVTIETNEDNSVTEEV